MDPLQRGQTGQEDGLMNGSRMSYGAPNNTSGPGPVGSSITAGVDGPPFIFPMSDSTFTTLRPISLRPPSLST